MSKTLAEIQLGVHTLDYISHSFNLEKINHSILLELYHWYFASLPSSIHFEQFAIIYYTLEEIWIVGIDKSVIN